MLAVAVVITTAPVLFAQKKHPKFTPPELATAADINYPISSAVSGVVAVAVTLDGAGTIKGTYVLRDIPSLTSPVLLSIQNWTFKPAMQDGKGIDSTIVVNIAYNPGDYRLGGAESPVLGQEMKTLSPDANGYLPAKTNVAAWAEYPLNSVAQGAVVMDARVNRRGRVTHVTAVWNMPPLEKASANAAKKWTFEPAALDGRPIGANTVIGYVFRPPNIASPVARP